MTAFGYGRSNGNVTSWVRADFAFAPVADMVPFEEAN